jgi:hypothetical protein
MQKKPGQRRAVCCVTQGGNMGDRFLSDVLDFDDVVELKTPALNDAPSEHELAKDELERLLALRTELEQTTGDKSASILDQHLDDTRRRWKIIELGHQIDKLTEVVLAQY